MRTFSLSHSLVAPATALIFLGAGPTANVMGELARGIRAFRTGIREDQAGPTAGEQLVEAPG